MIGVKKVIVTAAIALLAVRMLVAASFYVSTSGSNANPGTEAQPWLTIQYAVDHVGAGDTVLVRSGVYNELVTFNQSGSAGAYITLQNVPGASPVIDGSGLDAAEMPGLIKIIDHNYIVVNGFELRNLTSTHWAAGVWCRGTSRHIEIRNNTIHDIDDPNPEGGCHGVAFYGTNANAAMHDIILDGNEIYNLKLKWSEACAFNGNVRDFTVSNNVIHDVDNIAYVFIGFEGECADCPNGENVDRARSGHVYDNIAYNVDSKDNPPYNGERSADGFYVDGGMDIIFERNRAYRCNIGFEVASEHGGKNAENVKVRNNFIYNNYVAGLSTGGYDNTVGATDNCYFVNNSFYNNHISTRPQDDWGAEILINYHAHNNVYENNSIYAAENYPRVLTVGTDNTGNSIDYNLYFGSNEGDAPGSHSVFGDPLYMDAANGDLHIGDTSPAINQGFNHPDSVMGTTDFDNQPRIVNSMVDIGADEKDTASTLIDDPVSQFKTFKLSQNYPNPFNPKTVISYQVGTSGNSSVHVELSVFNILGQKVIELVNGNQSAGVHTIKWYGRDSNGNRAASGIYVYELKINGNRLARKMIMME